MTKEILARFAAGNLEELRNVLNQIVETHDDHHPSTIYVRYPEADGVKLYVEEETLTDGSKVLNVDLTGLHND